MFRFALSLLCLVDGSVALAASPEEAAALMNQPVELLLEDGRKPRGVLSTETNTEWLVLKSEAQDIVLQSRFAVRSVRRVERVTGPRLPEPDLEIPPTPTEPSSPLLPQFHDPCDVPFPCLPPLCAREPSLLFPAVDRIHAPRSLQIEARVANWNMDPGLDGLLLRVTPLDDWGRVVATDAQLDVELVTETRFATGGRIVSRDEPFAVSERWTVPVHAIGFDADGVRVQLPFRRVAPEWNYDLAPDAIVLARLRVPMAGTFDARDSQVTLRPSSRFRDDVFLRYAPR